MPIEILQGSNMSSAIIGWINSRDLDNHPTTQEVAAIDASVNELPTALFHFRDFTILERELFVTPRNHVIWARTSRVDDPRKFTTPEAFARPYHQAIRAGMQSMAALGKQQDEWRNTMPLCAHTSWTARLSFRDAIRMANYFEDVAHFIHGSNGSLAGHLYRTVLDFSGAIGEAFSVQNRVVFDAMKSFKRIPINTERVAVRAHRQKFGDFVSIDLHMPIVLRAQLVRHREIMVSDDFISMLREKGSEQKPISTMLRVQAVALNSTWRAVIGKRGCWMAQTDMWGRIASLALEADATSLPCADGVCPYAEDAKQRLAGNDPGAPCPRYSALTKTPVTPEQLSAMYREAGTRDEFWRGEVQLVTVQPYEDCPNRLGCPFPTVCTGEGSCDAKHNGYR